MSCPKIIRIISGKNRRVKTCPRHWMPHAHAHAHAHAERRFVWHIGLHHFADLRAVAEGLDIAQCVARYLGTEHGHEARSAHQQTVDAVRAIVRRRSEPWRLVGLVDQDHRHAAADPGGVCVRTAGGILRFRGARAVSEGFPH